MNLLLRRDYSGYDATLGVLAVAGAAFQTIERPWVPDANGPAGRKGVSCIPPGTYQLIPHDSEAHPQSFALVNHRLGVYHYPHECPPETQSIYRTAVLIHAANWVAELRGCIALGMTRRFTENGWMVQKSRDAVKLLHELVPWEHGHEITIRGVE
jgi:hypothetical protein